MSKYKKGIDFVVNVFAKRHYLKLLVYSIHKYTKGVDYTINLVNSWYGDESIGLKELDDMFKDDETVNIIQGYDQTSTTIIQADGTILQKEWNHVGKIDGNRKAAGSWYGHQSYTRGVKSGNREYVCIVDVDLIFLNEWVDKILPLTEDYFFVSNRWDPGNIYRECLNPIPELGYAKFMFFIMKRSNFVDNNLYPNLDYRDTGGNITLFAQENNLPFHILKNTYWGREKRYRYGVAYEDIKKWHIGGEESCDAINNKHHLIDLPAGEQMYTDGVPIAFHQNRGLYNTTIKNDDWVLKAGHYLNTH